jgi:hypothetical protein
MQTTFTTQDRVMLQSLYNAIVKDTQANTWLETRQAKRQVKQSTGKDVTVHQLVTFRIKHPEAHRKSNTGSTEYHLVTLIKYFS